MTEKNIFCWSKNYNDSHSFQQKRYRAFNKEVGEKRYNEISSKVRNVLKDNKHEYLSRYWENVTTEQWKALSEIPEFNREGIEFIIGFKLNCLDSDDVEISAIALNLIKEG